MRIALIAGLAVGVAIGGVYLARRMIAHEAITSWLESKGVQSQIDIERFEFNSFTGKLRVGSASSPDLTVDRVEAAYALRGFWNGRKFGVDLEAIRLVRPVVKGRFHGRVLTFGALDPIIEELRKTPPEPDAKKPLVLIENGRLFLETDSGALGLRGDGRVENGRLASLNARLDPTRISHGETSALIDGGRLDLLAQGDRIKVSAGVLLAEAQAGQGAARRGALRVSGFLPYPDIEKKQGAGAVTLDAQLTAEGLDWGKDSLQQVSVQARFDGRASGWIDTLALEGPLKATLDAAKGASGDLEVADLRAGGEGQVSWRQKDWRVAATAFAGARGAWSGLGEPRAGDDATTAALKRAARSFELKAPGAAVTATPRSMQVALTAPLTIAAESGAKAVLAARNGAPLYRDGAGALGVAASGGGLPALTLIVERYGLVKDGLDARVSAGLDGDVGPLVQSVVRTQGALRVRDETLAYAASDCLSLKAAGVELGDNDLRDFDGRICPAGGPLITATAAGWSARAQVKDAMAKVPTLEVAVEGAEADVRLKSGRSGGLNAVVELTRAGVTDTAKERRFMPVRATGSASLAGDRLTGLFLIKDPAGRGLTQANVSADLAAETGEVRIDTGDLVFSPDGLQPVAISPLAQPLGSAVAGQVRFEGGLQWAGRSMRSGGVLRIAGLDFRSAAGAVSGLAGDLTFTSLDPLRTAPDQVLTVRQIETLAVLTEVEARFQLDGDLVRIAKAEVSTGEGRLRLAPTTATLSGSAPIQGVVDVEGVQLRDVVARSPFADHVAVDAKVSGTLPFVLQGESIKFTNGRLSAVQPGRVSISREALSGVEAEGGAAATGQAAAPAQTNTVTEFAFQALEHLAFESLSAEVNSLPQGRLGVLFHIKGEHLPPSEQDLRVGVMDLVRGDILNRKLPLPSHTKVDLTLDTSVNLDEILADFARTQRVDGSAPVQP